MDHNIKHEGDEEQWLISQNIKKEKVKNDEHEEDEDQDPLAVQYPVGITFRVLKKEEKDVLEEDIRKKEKDIKEEGSQDERGTADIQNTSSDIKYGENENLIFSSILQNGTSGNSQDMEHVSSLGKESSYALSTFQQKHHKKIYEECSCTNSKEMNCGKGHNMYKCDDCDKICSKFSDLTDHIKAVHLRISDYKHDKCNKMYTYSHNLKIYPYSTRESYNKYENHYQNMRISCSNDLEHGAVCRERKFVCHDCRKRFIAFSFLKCHIQAVHLKINRFKSVHCNKPISLPSGNCPVQKYIEKNDSQVCRKQFSNASSLEQNSAVNKERKFVCGDCGGHFFRFFDLNNHINEVHCNRASIEANKHFNLYKNKKKYACNSCDRKYSKISDVEVHIKGAHLGIGDYKCVECHKYFPQPSKLKIHVWEIHENLKWIIHNNVYKFVCQVCNKRFLNPGNLTLHSVVHKEKKFACNDCSKKFVGFSDLNNHIIAVHSEIKSETSSQKIIIHDNNKYLNIHTRNGKLNIHSTNKIYACTNCDERYSWIRDLKKHIGDVHFGIGNFKCAQCSKIFSQPAKLINHVCSSEYKCQICNSYFSNLDSLKQHSVIHDRSYDFKCSQHVRASELKKHLKTYECNVCNQQFAHKSKLKQHNIVHKQSRFVCNECDGTFVEFSDLQVHITAMHCEEKSEATSRESNSKKMYVCGGCHKKYSRANELRSHITESHLGSCYYKCGQCSNIFLRSFQLIKHINSEHKYREYNFHGKDRKYACAHCNQRYSQFKGLKFHIEGVHLGCSGYKCEQCNKTYSSRATLKKHVKSDGHKNFKKFVCDICNKKFSHLPFLRTHIGIHNIKKKLVCEYCGKELFSISTLKLHINTVHDKVRDFKCDVCKKTFQLLHHLRSHIICVHEKFKNFVCEQCGDRFLLAHHLRNHINHIHKGIERNKRTVNYYTKLIGT